MNEIMDKLSELSAAQREMLTNQSNQQKLLEKHGQLLEKQGEVLLRNTITVETHEKRSTALEKEIRRLDIDVEGIKTEVTSVKAVWKAAGWVVGILGTIGSALVGIYELFRK